MSPAASKPPTATPLPPSSRRLVTHDLRVVRDRVVSLVNPHEVCAPRTVIDAVTDDLLLTRTRLVFVRYGERVVVETAPTPLPICAVLPLGPMALMEPGSLLPPDTSAFVLHADRRTLIRPDPWSGSLILTAHPDDLQIAASRLLGEPVEPPVFFSGRGGRRLVAPEHLTQVARSAWRAAVGVESLAPTAQRALVAELLAAMLLSLPHSLTGRMARRAESEDQGSGSTTRATLAAQWMETHLAEPITVGDVARAVNLGMRRLQEVVTDRYGVPPSHLLRDMRLARAHDLLRSGDADSTTVTAVAHACGFGNLGRFAALYRGRYGLTPLATLRGGPDGKTPAPAPTSTSTPALTPSLSRVPDAGRDSPQDPEGDVGYMSRKSHL